MSIQNDFDQAVIRSRELTEKPANEDLLKLYGYFKQATEGNVTGERPGGYDFKAAAKYDAWSSLNGTSKESAMEAYIKLVNTLHDD